MNKTCQLLLVSAAVFFALSILAIPTRSAPAIFQGLGSALACVWGVWLFWDKADK